MMFMDSDNLTAFKIAPMFVILMFLGTYMFSEVICSSVAIIYYVYRLR
jgi:hypothetical protein